MDRVAADLGQLAKEPSLLLWGPSDPIFSDRYLNDLATRLPRSEIHRFSGSGHLVPEDADVASAVHAWIGQLEHPVAPALAPPDRERAWAALDRRSADRKSVV